MDPFFLGYVGTKLNLGEIQGDVLLSNLTILGLSKAHFGDVRPHFLDDDMFRLEIDVDVPLLYAESDIDVNGTLNVFKISGKGKTTNSIVVFRKLSHLFYPIYSFMIKD